MDRRTFISNFSIVAGGLATAYGAFGRRAEAFIRTGDLSGLRSAGYGSLVPTPAKNTGEMFLALPKGFEYNVIGKTKSVMADGRPTPPLHDGMAAFRVKNELRLVRNHEVFNGRIPHEGSGIGTQNHYDETAGGGTTTLVIDPKTRTIVRDFVSLSGTLINCAGGPTPWGSWISCEETTLGQTVRTSSRGIKTGGFQKAHGYCFEVPASANSNLPPVPLKAMGRFVHEAIAVDAKTGVIYLTEDNNPAGFYRFLPNRNGRMAEGGTLQMLAISGNGDYDTRTGQKTGTALNAAWVTIKNPDPPEADVDESAVFKQGRSEGGVIFARLEGCYAAPDGRIFFVSTNGGDNKGGQIWVYEPKSRTEGTLRLVFESPDREILDMPDNICLMPRSNMLFICEDSDYIGVSATPENYVRILTPNGRISDFAKNISEASPKSEFAGSTFSPDGATLFVNLQTAGVTLAIWGKWGEFQA